MSFDHDTLCPQTLSIVISTFFSPLQIVAFRNHMSLLELDFIIIDNVYYTKEYVLRLLQEKEFELFKRNWSCDLNTVKRTNGTQSKLL